MFTLLFEKSRTPKIVSILVLGVSISIVYVFGKYIDMSEEFKSSYLTVLSILSGFIFSIIIFVNDQLSQLRHYRVSDDAMKQNFIRYTRFYSFLTYRLLVAIFLAIALMITMLISYWDIPQSFGKTNIGMILWGGKFILCCCSLYFWILTGIIMKGIFSFITHRKAETIDWLYSIKFNDSHRSINE